MLLTHNYHTHTARCGHASGTDRAYVEEAIRCGFDTLGFSDHTPYPFHGVDDSGIRMRCAELEDYVRSVLALREEYKSDIRILLGLEVEYYPRFFAEWKTLVEPYPFDYFLLGQHFVGDEHDGVYSGWETDDPAVLKGYVDQTIEAMRTGLFLYLAHPDLIRYRDNRSPLYETEMTRLCEAAKSLAVPLEINLLGIWDRRWYPNPFFWEIAGRVQNEVVIGADAHRPEKLYPKEALDEALRLIEVNRLHRKQILL